MFDKLGELSDETVYVSSFSLNGCFGQKRRTEEASYDQLNQILLAEISPTGRIEVLGWDPGNSWRWVAVTRTLAVVKQPQRYGANQDAGPDHRKPDVCTLRRKHKINQMEYRFKVKPI